MNGIFSFKWFLSPLICVLVGLYFGVWEYFTKTMRDEVVLVSHIVNELFSYWLIWAMLSPLILILARRFPFERPHLFRNLLIHLPAGLFCATLSTALYLLFLYISDIFTKARPFQTLNSYYVLPSGIIPNVIIYWTILGINLGFYFYERYQKELLKASQLDAQLSNARLQALQMQLHPHFLFNTLHSISALALENEPWNAVKMINRLSEFLRLTLDNADMQIVPLENELEFVRRYLEIERVRFHNRLAVDWKIDPQALTAQVPNLILQPLVENAMRHAVDSNLGTSRIQIAAHLKNGRVLMEVRDDGKDSKKIAEQNNAAGMGLKNTRARLSELYGKDYSFNLSRRQDDWTVAQIIIPFVRAIEQPKGDMN